jgi:hypothetical protein
MTPTHEQLLLWLTPERMVNLFSKMVTKRTDYSVGAPDCWLWTGRVNYGGHAEISVTLDGKRYTVPLHRLLYVWRYGNVIPGTIIRHIQCGNPACCHFLHLLAGDRPDNVDDAVRAGTHSKVNTARRKKKHKDAPGMAQGQGIDSDRVTPHHCKSMHSQGSITIAGVP